MTVSQSRQKAPPNIVKSFKKKLYPFSYQLIVHNKMSIYIYCLMYTVYLFLVLILPLEILINFNRRDSDLPFQNLNYIFYLGRLPQYLVLTDVVNASLLLLLVVTILSFLTLDQASLAKQRKTSIFYFLSFACMITGKFLAYFFISLQLKGIECYFAVEQCFGPTGTERLVTNIIGIVLSLFFNWFVYNIMECVVPEMSVPWAQPLSSFNYIYRVQGLLAASALAFQNQLDKQYDFEVFLIPILIIQTFQMGALLFNKAAFNSRVELTVLIKDSVVWTFSLFAFILEFGLVLSSISYIVLVIICTLMVTGALYLWKEKTSHNQIFKKQFKNDYQAEKTLQTILQFSQSADEKKDLKLRKLYLNHKFYCSDLACICGGSSLSYNDPTQKQFASMNYSTLIKFDQAEEDTSVTAGAQQVKASNRKHRSDTILLLNINKFKKQFDKSQRLSFFQVFVKTKFMDGVFTSFYELLKLKKYCKSRHDCQTYQYLKILVVQKTRNIQRQSKVDIFDVDSVIQVDELFLDYKRLIFETSTLVGRFWENLSKQDMLIIQQMEMGNKLVDQYLQIREIYEEVLLLKPDHKELVSISIHFNQDVMNFEMEALQQMNFLKNIEQKIKITRQNQYYLTKDQQGIVLMSANPKTKHQIVYSNKNICETLGYTQTEMLRKEVTFLMPKIIAQVHHNFVDRFLNNDHKRHLLSSLNKIWVKKADGSIALAKATVQTCISDKLGLVIVAFLTPIVELLTSNILCKADSVYVLLADDRGWITNYSANFLKKFVPNDSAFDEESMHNLDDLFTNLADFSPEELEQGVRTNLITNFADPICNLNTQMVIDYGVALSIQTYSFAGNLKIQEVIFVERDTFASSFSGDVQFKDRRTSFRYSGQEADDDDVNEVEDASSMDREAAELDEINHNESASSASGSSASTAMMMSKGVIDFKQIPQSLQNLRRAIFLFFFILIATSFSVLAVTIVSYREFEFDSEAVIKSIQLTSQLASLRLGFRALLTFTRINSNEFTGYYQTMQDYLVQISDELRQNQNYLISVQQYADDELKNLLDGRTLILYDLQSSGKIQETSTSFTIGIYQYLTRMQNILSLNREDFFKHFSNIRLRRVTGESSTYARDALFLITNGNDNIRDQSVLIARQYVLDARDKEEDYIYTVLIISLCCIIITFLTSCIMIPVIFALDNEQEDIVRKWMLISEPQKHEVLLRITDFTAQFSSDKLEDKRPSLSKFTSKEECISENHSIFTKSIFSNMGNSRQRSFDQIQIGNDGNFQDSLPDQKVISRKQGNSQNTPPEMANKSINQEETKDDQDRSFQYLMDNTQKQCPKEEGPRKKSKNEVRFDQSYVQQEKPSSGTFVTTNNKTTNNNMQTTWDDQITEAQSREGQMKQLRSIYLSKKAKKIVIIMSFSLVIIAFYIASYFITRHIFTSSTESYDYLQTISQRGPCLQDSFTVLTETLASNKTQYFNQGTILGFDYLKDTCLNLEKEYESYLTRPPSQIVEMHPVMMQLNTKKACQEVFQENPVQIERCQTYYNGQLRDGIQNAINSVYYFLIQNMVSFNSVPPIERTREFLTEVEFSDQLLSQTVIVFDFLLPSFNYLRVIMNRVLSDYLVKQVAIYVAIFCIFIVFLLVSLVIAMKIVIIQLRKVVYRTRVLLKIIPVQELQKIQKQELLQKNKY